MNPPLRLFSWVVIFKWDGEQKSCGVKFVLDVDLDSAYEQLLEIYPYTKFNHFFNEEVSLDVKQVLN